MGFDRHTFRRMSLLAMTIAAWLGVSSDQAWAWQAKRLSGTAIIQSVGGDGIVIEGEVPANPQTTPAQPEAKPADAKPADGEKKDGEKKVGDKKLDEKKDAPPPVTTRPMKPATPPNPDELKNLKPDRNGKLKFNLKGQPWADVLEWLAETSNKSLDWQELPADYLNLVTQRSYSVEEARDLINRHLLARGFTMLLHGETISVVNIAKINPGMVPRVDPSALAGLPDHDYVKTSFALDWLLANEAETELKPMLSPNGKLTHLAATNRLEAMDSVLNLRQIWDVIQEEQSGGKQERLVREFKLKHTKALEVVDYLHTLLGMNKPSVRVRKNRGGGGDASAMMNPDMMAQFQQQMQQMMQQQAQQQQAAQQPAAGGAPGRKPAEVNLLANERENSVLVNAPPDKMAIIAQAIKTLDVMPGEDMNFLQNVQRMQVYRLSGVDPMSLIDLLDDVGNLEPTTKLQVDNKNKSIVAYASLADHLTIRMLVEKLDGTGRKFQVIPLRRLEADYVAGTIEFMMGGEEKDKNQNRRNPYYFEFYDPYGMGRTAQTDNNDKFRVDADVENNRLLLWANEIELREIENLLMKLGELPPPGGNRSRQRYLETMDPADAQQLLDRVRRMWPGIAPNELLIEEGGTQRRPSGSTSEPAAEDKPTPKTPLKSPASKPSSKKAPPKSKSVPATTAPKAAAVDRQASDEQLALQPNEREIQKLIAEIDSTLAAGESNELPQLPARRFSGQASRTTAPAPPPIRIRRAPDGRLILESEDTDALDQLEELMYEAAPPKRDYKIFQLKFPTTWAFSVKLRLEEFFEDKDKKKSGSSWNPWYGMRLGSGNDQETLRRLSKRKPLKFVSDSDSGTIIVQGADAAQLKVIQELIDLYDRPPETDGKQVRKTQIFTLKFSKASVIGEAIKDVYRDLLSANDKAYQNQPGKEGQKPPERNYTFIYGGAGDDSKDKQQPETPVKFKGLISLGVDDVSNTIIVSAPTALLINVSELIDQLDRAARPTNSVQVVKVNNGVNSAELQKRLAKIFVKPKQTPQQPKPGQQQPQQPNQPQPQEQAEEPVFFP